MPRNLVEWLFHQTRSFAHTALVYICSCQRPVHSIMDNWESMQVPTIHVSCSEEMGLKVPTPLLL